jgi:hypothetical protein
MSLDVELKSDLWVGHLAYGSLGTCLVHPLLYAGDWGVFWFFYLA